MLTAIVILAFVISFIFLYFMFKGLFRNYFTVQKRIEAVIQENAEVEEEKSYFQGLADRLTERHKRKSQKMEGPKENKLQNLLEASGLSKRYTVGQWLMNKYIMIVAVGGLFFFLGVLSKTNPLKLLLLELVIIISIQFAFRFLLLSAVKKRKGDILKNLPYTLDLVTVSVEAGLSFDGAIARVMDATSNALTDEFAKALKEMRMGIQRRTALRSLSVRCDVKELTTVVNALIQADELGISLGKVLRIQADQVREMRKQIAREKSMKAPIKMLFPLIFFIFPTIFIVILGPALIQIIEYFSGK